MKPTELLLSAFFLAFIALKGAEGVFQLEDWPLTHVPMFSRRVPPSAVPMRVTP